MINEEVRDIVEAELAEGEELLWADKPDYRTINLISLQIFSMFVLPGILFLFLGFWFLTSLDAPENGKAFFTTALFILGIMGVCSGLNETYKSQKHKENFYAISNQRVMSKVAVDEGYSRFNIRRGAATLVERKMRFGTGIFNVLTHEKPTEQPTMTIIAYVKNPNQVEQLLQKFIA